MLRLLANHWWVVLIRGGLAILLGIIAIAMPVVTLTTLLFVFGAFAAGDGLTAIWLGFRARHERGVWWELVAEGVLMLIAGTIAALMPGVTAVFLVFVIGISAILRGVLEIAAAIKLRKVIDDEWMLVLSGGLSLLFGVLLLSRPGVGAIALVQVIGAYLIVVGSMMVGLSLRLRHLKQKSATPIPA